ncbi:MAG: hypothetical protein ACYS0K_14125 [Planctomycetota bacterium]|jgi:hypothetical protein
MNPFAHLKESLSASRIGTGGFMASVLVLELEKLGCTVEAAFPDDRAEQVAAELKQLAAEVPPYRHSPTSQRPLDPQPP